MSMARSMVYLAIARRVPLIGAGVSLASGVHLAVGERKTSGTRNFGEYCGVETKALEMK